MPVWMVVNFATLSHLPPKYQNKTKQNQKTPKKFKTDESLRRGPKKIQDN